MPHVRFNRRPGNLLMALISLTAASSGAALGGAHSRFETRPIVQSATSGQITGFVRRGGDEAVSAAMVIISDSDGRIRSTARTNAQGSFAFSGLPSGSYVMQGCSDRFGPSTSETIELEAGANVSRDLRISTDAPIATEVTCDLDSISAPPVRRSYTGDLMSFDLIGDVRDFFASTARIAGVDLRADPSTTNKVVIHLKNVPWDLALDVVVRTAGLGSELDGKVLRITTANPALGQDRVLMGTVAIVGTVTEVDTQSVRTQLHVNAPNADGKIQIWSVEWETADYLEQIGIKPNTLRAGDQIIATGNITRTNAIRLISIQRPSDGFSWGYLGPVRAPLTNGSMFVGLVSQ